MITVTVSFKPDESNAEVLAQVVRLLAGLKDSIPPTPYSAPIETEVKATKPRKARVYTDEQKAEFRARMVAAREAKANASGSAPVEPAKVEGSKKPSQSKQVAKSSTKVATMPRTGQKLVAKPAAQ